MARYLPILSWLPKYERVWLRGDIIAGVTVLALLIPEGMAYAEIARLPPQTAFYAAPIGLLLYAIFGSSRQLVVVVSAAIATVSAAAVAPLASAGSLEYAALSAGLAVMAGLISILAGLFKLGRIASFFSESVLTGFITGLALTISIKQIPKLFGFEGGEGNFWQRLTISSFTWTRHIYSRLWWVLSRLRCFCFWNTASTRFLPLSSLWSLV